MLQPLLENAVLHGIQELPEGGVISVSIQCKGNRLHCRVSNPLGDSSYSGGTQQGLANIRDRLAALFGAAGELSVVQTEQQFVVQLQMPMQQTTLNATKQSAPI
jgi:two-component system sensor histidine kinase AlgZ